MVFTEKMNFTINVTMMILLLGFLIAGVTWKVNIENEVVDNGHEIERIENIQKGVVKEQIDQNVLFAEIRTDLKWIQSRLEGLEE